MKVKHLEIQNFRKLKSCRLDVSEKETILVGANNSGKTSAMDALIFFLKKKGNLRTTDITLSNWIGLNKLGTEWIDSTDEQPADLTLERWIEYLPSLDIWLEVTDDEVHYVAHLIPTLDWTGGLIGVRLLYLPTDIEKLYKDFKDVITSNQNVTDGKEGKKLDLWPNDLKDFLDKRITNYFSLKSYVLDPQELSAPNKGSATPQSIKNYDLDLGTDPLNGIVKVDIINAQRGFSDSNNEEETKSTGKLSSQLREYYSKHLNPEDNPSEDDIDALRAIAEAQESFDKRLNTSFGPSVGELENLGYPGFSDPSITLSSRVDPMDSINHSTAVRFDIMKEKGDNSLYSLPENYNGLGYQNLVSMVFRLIRFRDDWLRIGKKGSVTSEDSIEPIHLVLIEEPEAHLHVQVQQVFIRKAHSVLSNHKILQNGTNFSTQLILSTHSSHIAHEIDFSSLRYFKREEPSDLIVVPTATVVNLSEIFGSEDKSIKFAIRYLKTTHCDLFFADAIILVEGAAERMLVPHFITNHYKSLTSRYITILEVGGSHAHRLKPVIDALDIPTLIITDIDSCDPKERKKAVFPERGKGYISNNDSLKEWVPKIENFDDLLKLDQKKKITADGKVCIAYQAPFNIKVDGTDLEIIPYTFEDSLFFTNFERFKTIEGTGFIKKFYAIANDTSDPSSIRIKAYDEVKDRNNSKAKFALDLLFSDESESLEPPLYISEGLEWLSSMVIKES